MDHETFELDDENFNRMNKKLKNEACIHTIESIARNGLWQKICNECNFICGGMLAEFGKPEDDEYLACPQCGNSKKKEDSKGFRLEFLPGALSYLEKK